jgi:predicted ATP-binding protein involved in virulence
MRIDRLTIQNFKRFDRREFILNPNFNLVVGDNGAGKTSVLDALSIAVGSWFLGLKGYSSPPGIDSDEVRVSAKPYRDRFFFEPQYPCRIETEGLVMGEKILWAREIRAAGGKTTSKNAQALAEIAHSAQARVQDESLQDGLETTLPLLGSYGAERLWFETGHRTKKAAASTPRQSPSRLRAYEDSLYFEIQESVLLKWIKSEISKSEQLRHETVGLRILREAITDCVEGAKSFYYDWELEDVVVIFEESGPQLFRNLSDGQRMMLTMIGDLSRRAASLNPHLEEDAIKKTPGIVLIDELDMHLHPTWQRRVIADLKRTFPAIQFIVTTHSPQLIGEANPDEVLLLEENGVYHPSQSFGLDSSRVLTEVMQATDRTASVGELTRKIAELVDKEDFKGAEKLIAELEKIVGENDPEVLRPRGIIRFLETAS